jgi:hypothetical protein
MTHIVIKLDHEPFEVTRESIENLPDWVGEGQANAGLQHWHYWWGEDDGISGPFGHYLVSYRARIEVWPPEDVERYIKNPYEECAKVADVEYDRTITSQSSYGSGRAAAAEEIAQAIRQLEKERGK